MLLAKTLSIAFLLGFSPAAPVPAPDNLIQVQANGFANWVANFRSRAAAKGITRRTFDAAFAGAQYLPETVRKDRNQSDDRQLGRSDGTYTIYPDLV